MTSGQPVAKYARGRYNGAISWGVDSEHAAGNLMKKRIIYGESNYAALVRKNGYFVDKTEYIAKLESVSNPIFLRPRRFGKSLCCSLLWHYYDLNFAADFDELFGHTWIGQHPTGQQNQYIVLFLNFSSIATGLTIVDIDASFRRQCNFALKTLQELYETLLSGLPPINLEAPVADNLSNLLSHLRKVATKLYVIIDEYDNFGNQLITTGRDHLYHQLTEDDSFLKTFFKTLKEGRESGVIANVFITG
ncbi:MAG: AAA family ATPase, partial [Caldilineaceae bacterium]|nr:AAA family ATPase [Caldilineaceae bacterium]